MSANKTIIRKAKNKENPYVMVAKACVQDDRLSWQATGMLSYILSLPDDWQIYVNELCRHKSNGIVATRTILNELIHAGYVTRRQDRDETGRYRRYEYVVHERPQPHLAGISTALQESVCGQHNNTNTELTKGTDEDQLDDWVTWIEAMEAKARKVEAMAVAGEVALERELREVQR